VMSIRSIRKGISLLTQGHSNCYGPNIRIQLPKSPISTSSPKATIIDSKPVNSKWGSMFNMPLNTLATRGSFFGSLRA
jgi:hypothetical protein